MPCARSLRCRASSPPRARRSSSEESGLVPHLGGSGFPSAAHPDRGSAFEQPQDLGSARDRHQRHERHDRGARACGVATFPLHPVRLNDLRLALGVVGLSVTTEALLTLTPFRCRPVSTGVGQAADPMTSCEPVEPPSRLELETYGLRNRCSTTELRWQPDYVALMGRALSHARAHMSTATPWPSDSRRR